MSLPAYKLLVRVTFLLALFVVVLGAYVRLTDAGLGCPDWPGCYGNILVPMQEEDINAANNAYPDMPLEAGKAWKEMIHRYIAATLGILILAIAFFSWKRRYEFGQPLFIPFLLPLLVAFQGALGMWTVTMLVMPVIVLSHLMGGMTIVLLLWLLVLRTSSISDRYSLTYKSSRVTKWAVIAFIAVVIQIFLGGWTSTNYAALVCPDFPTCRGEWIPDNMDFKNAFTFMNETGVNYEGGKLGPMARTAIQFSHRIGAFIVSVIVFITAIRALLSRQFRIKTTGLVLLLVLAMQLSLGIANIVYVLPLSLAVAHNGGAAILLITIGTLLYYSAPRYFIGRK